MKTHPDPDKRTDGSPVSSQVSPSNGATWVFDNSYCRLPAAFYARHSPTPVKAPAIAVFNQVLAETLGLNPEALNSAAGAAIFAGNQLPLGAEPIAQAYAGHQFGHFNILGDGRAILLGEHISPNGERFDIQLKGSGPTPFSRRGDGRATLGPMLREYILSEAMFGLGIPSSRSLAVVTTGELVYREKALPGAVLTRVASSHIRVGTFEYFAARKDHDKLKKLADYTLLRHHLSQEGCENPYLGLLYAAMDRQAALIANWLLVGFIHGVMNTDNMAISGETLDYGPCAFMDSYDPATVFSSIDSTGRYAYGNQSKIAAWNLARFAECLLPLIDEEQSRAIALASEAINSFAARFQDYWLAGMRRKLGLLTEETGDLVLIENLLKTLHKHRADFTNTFRSLSLEAVPNEPFFQHSDFIEWHSSWQQRLARQAMPKELSRSVMDSNNPAIIPRNVRVEEALQAAVDHQDFTVMHKLLRALSKPYAEGPDSAEFRQPPSPSARGYKTFCGT